MADFRGQENWMNPSPGWDRQSPGQTQRAPVLLDFAFQRLDSCQGWTVATGRRTRVVSQFRTRTAESGVVPGSTEMVNAS